MNWRNVCMEKCKGCGNTDRELHMPEYSYFKTGGYIIHNTSTVTFVCSECGEEESIFIIGGVTW